jgi:exopolysaccharide production protein ExoZ
MEYQATPSPVISPQKFISLQYLRAIAALGVVLYHIEGGINGYMASDFQMRLFFWGYLGVSLFFVLSGFVISYSASLRSKSPFEFLYGRLARIYPAYLFVATLFILSLLAIPSGVFRTAPNVSFVTILKTLVFDFGNTGGYVYVGWTLFYEICFYMAFACIVSMFPKVSKSSWFYLFIAALLINFSILAQWRIVDFLLGIASFLIIVNPRQERFTSPLFIILFMSVIAPIFSSPFSVFCVFVIIFLCFAERIRPEIFGSKLMILLGDSSYSIYLVQVLLVSACLKMSKLLVSNIFPFGENYFAFYFIAVVISLTFTISAGILMRRFIEKPSFNFLMNSR